MVTTVSSAAGYSGQVFQFKTTANVSSNGFDFPAGSLGYGVVLSAIPASNRERNGAIPVPGLGLAVDETTKGTNITIGPGYNFHLVPIGNLQQRGPCLQSQS